MQSFTFESGMVLKDVQIAFQTWGTLNDAGDNAVVVCHALTGDASAGPSDTGQGWWGELIGPNRPIDTNRYFVIASNVLGGCSGSTGPQSLGPDGKPYALRFPLVSVRDMVRAQIQLVNTLGVRSIALVAGGSLGGMQVWEWALLQESRVQHAVVIAAHAVFPAFGIGYNAAMRQSIVADPDWQDGDYYGTGREPAAGFAAARSIGMLTYRTDLLYQQRFGRKQTQTIRVNHCTQREAFTMPLYEVESYLYYQGTKLQQRFDANSYLYLTRAMDGHDIGRDRGGLAEALGKIRSRLTVIGISSDTLYAPRDLLHTVTLAKARGVNAQYIEIDSIYGHDAFLAEQRVFGEMIQTWMREETEVCLEW